MPDNSGMSNEELKFLKGQESIVILEVLHVLSFSVRAVFFLSFFFFTSNMELSGNLYKTGFT